MNRLLRVGFDILLTSVTPILGWLLLGIIVDKNLINIFSLIYPLQFVISTIKIIFGTGANISAVRDNDRNVVFSGIVLGGTLGFIILGIVIINIDKYITFMNMDIEKYKVFGIYGTIQFFFQLLLNLSLCKLYYEGNNKKANKYSFLFNLINFTSLITMSLITKNQILIVSVSIIITSLFVIIMMAKIVERTKMKINLKNCIKYDSATLCSELSMFIIYLFGLKTAFEFGEKYILAMSFATLISDTQWDMLSAIKIVAQIDIAKRVFSHKEHIKNSKKYTLGLMISSITMGQILYPFYHVDITATIIIVGVELFTMYMDPFFVIKIVYMQLEYSALKTTLGKQVAYILRIGCSFIASPYCTSIGLIVSQVYQLIYANWVIRKNKISMEMLSETQIQSIEELELVNEK